jgi:hypothetical protein
MFNQHLSWDAHPSIEALNRYYVAPDAGGARRALMPSQSFGMLK